MAKGAGVIAAAGALFCLVGCGGGGGGSSGGGTSGALPGDATLSLASRSVSATANYGDPAPTTSVRLSVKDAPSATLYVGAGVTGPAVANADFNPVSSTESDVLVYLRNPVELEQGTSTATVTVQVCYDPQCSRQVRGSPASIAVEYTVSSRSSVSLASAAVVAVNASLEENAPPPVVTQTVNVSSPPAGGVTFKVFPASNNVQSVTNGVAGQGIANVELTFASPVAVGVGRHDEAVSIQACYDPNCLREIPGSPLVVQTSYTVYSGAGPEPGLTPLAYLSRSTLPHDVVDAEYVRSLDAIAMVSSAPTNAFYLYDVATATERQVALNRTPTAVSVAPDGMSVAIGHDALITYVDLAALLAGTPSTKLLNVSTRVFDLVLDGRGYVHALPAADQWVDFHTVNVATSVETTTWGQLYAGTLGRLHPSGDYVYTADNGLSPSDIAKYDVRDGVVTRLYDSPYHGDYEMCGNLWFKEDGATIYTRCGNTFRSSALQSQDMIYSGRLTLSTSQYYGYQIDSLSQADTSKEIVLLESDGFLCSPNQSGLRCYTHFAVYESDFLNRTGLFSLAPIEAAGNSYRQRGLFVFHSRDGLHKYLISRLDPAPNTSQSYFVTTLQ